MSDRHCIKCDRTVDHHHVMNHHKSRVEGNAQYQKQIAADIAAGMVPAKDERRKLNDDTERKNAASRQLVP